jgi:hypothetical protein
MFCGTAAVMSGEVIETKAGSKTAPPSAYFLIRDMTFAI